MLVEVTTPEDFVGNVIGDLSSRRGFIIGMDDVSSKILVRTEAPLANMLGYSIDLAKLTSGKGNYSMKFIRYDKAPSSGGPDDAEPASMALRVA